MEPERWQRIEQLYQAALEQEPGQRGMYLEQVCGPDESLRREVEGLLALEDQAQGFIDVPALEITARHIAENPRELTIGQTVDRYRILALLGAGGMGKVYSARDSRLGRTVALKFLLDEFSERQTLERFRREARALSALNHPNICTIYDIGEAGGRTFIAMEYVPGKTLDRLAGRKRLPLNDALKYAVQIAEGLAKAHAAGIIHRDLKPGNIMATEEGHVKLLDFGLAKLTEFGQSPESANDRSEGPPTEEGTILGTVAYMSPEQAEGKKLDPRSDIFSFGAVLYEMITGRRAFAGDSTISTLSEILHKEPTPLGQIAPEAPRELERIVVRCLRKDPERRFQNAADLKVALQEIADEALSGKLANDGTATPPRRRVPLRIIAACALGLVALAAVIWLSSQTAAKQPGDLVITRLTSDSGLTRNPVISRDGKSVAYASDRSGGENLDIWVQQVAGGQSIRLTNNPADETHPDFSPDGSKIVFRSERDGGGIYVVSSLGGDERIVATANKAMWPRFSPDGNWIAYSVGTGQGVSKIYTISATGGSPRELKIQIPWANAPTWSPDGRYLIFLGSTDPLGFSAYEWWVAPVQGGQAVNTGALAHFERSGFSTVFNFSNMQDEDNRIAAHPSVWSGDRITFSCKLGDSVNLWQVAINPKTWSIQDRPQRLTVGSGPEYSPSLAADGRMVFATVDQRLNLWMLPIDANGGKATGKPQPLTQTGGNNFRPSLSSDGRRLVFVSERSGNAEIWLRDMDSGKEKALTATPWTESHPYITADGSKIMYQSLEGPEPQPIYVMPIGKGVAEKFCDDCGLPMAWSPDGSRIFFHQRETAVGRWRTIDVVTRQRVDVIRHTKYNLHTLRVSPDGKWLAFCVPDSQGGRSPIVIAPLREGLVGEDEWIRVTDGSTIEVTPWWSPDGAILYFLSKRDGFQCIWAQRLDKVTKRQVGAPLDIAHFHGARHSLRQVGFGPGAAGDKLIYTMRDSTGNIWMAERRPVK